MQNISIVIWLIGFSCVARVMISFTAENSAIAVFHGLYHLSNIAALAHKAISIESNTEHSNGIVNEFKNVLK